MLDPFIEPGALVRHPGQPDWGVGQVQTVVGPKVTVNFEDAGKQVIDTAGVRLTWISGDPRE
jgi:transcription elongation factor GreA-like protein